MTEVYACGEYFCNASPMTAQVIKTKLQLLWITDIDSRTNNSSEIENHRSLKFEHGKQTPI